MTGFSCTGKWRQTPPIYRFLTNALLFSIGYQVPGSWYRLVLRTISNCCECEGALFGLIMSSTSDKNGATLFLAQTSTRPTFTSASSLHFLHFESTIVLGALLSRAYSRMQSHEISTQQCQHNVVQGVGRDAAGAATDVGPVPPPLERKSH